MKRFVLSNVKDQVFDIAIIGGGITGAAAARDAALRGLSVVVVEKTDFASGASSRSTKLLHGGVRYRQSFEFKLVREACRERELMLKLAPHLAHVRPFIYTLYKGYPESMWLLNIGLSIYDLFSGSPLKRRHRMLNVRKLLAQEPALKAQDLIGGGWYYDFLTDDARLTIETLKAASAAGAQIANYMEATGFVMQDRRICGVQVVDHISGERGAIRARQVINAAGTWVDQVRYLEEGVTGRIVRPTKGVHIVVRKKDFPLNHAVFIRSPRDNRLIWPIPALDDDLVYIGTTDTDYDESIDKVTATQEDIDYLLEAANYALPDAHLGYEHIVGTWAGLRPLIKLDGPLATSSVSREHQIFTSPGGLLTIAGGKLTTARVMGLLIVQAAIRLLEKNYGIKDVPASRTHQIPLSGGDVGALFAARRQAREMAISTAVKDRWLSHYGSNFTALSAIARTDPTAAQELGEAHITLAEVRYALQDEMAVTVSDFFTHRASIFYWQPDGGLAIAEKVAAEMGEALNWNADEQKRQVEAYRDWVNANRFNVQNIQPAL
ncbi:MAG TPA: glycerol-3-phosphate dehydrogenase/oxidase [Ktedonobacteraceae bacterium]|jgi:glycerol-3-phosphate dehydrogenase